MNEPFIQRLLADVNDGIARWRMWRAYIICLALPLTLAGVAGYCLESIPDLAEHCAVMASVALSAGAICVLVCNAFLQHLETLQGLYTVLLLPPEEDGDEQ